MKRQIALVTSWFRANPKLAWWWIVTAYLAFSVQRRTDAIFSRPITTADLVLYCVFLAVICVPLVKEVKVKDFAVSPFDLMPTPAEIQRNEAVVDDIAEGLQEGADEMSAILGVDRSSARIFRIKANLVAEIQRLCRRALQRRADTPQMISQSIASLAEGGILTKPMADAVNDLIKLASAAENGRHLNDQEMRHLTEYGPKTLLVLRSVPA
jgi:hypothetical protein